MEPVEGAMNLVVLYREGTIDQSDLEVAIGIALLSGSRSQAIRLAGKYGMRKFVEIATVVRGMFYDSNFEAFPHAVGWLWLVLRKEGTEAFESVKLQIRNAIEQIEKERGQQAARERILRPSKIKNLGGEWVKIGDLAEALGLTPFDFGTGSSTTSRELSRCLLFMQMKAVLLPGE